MAVLPILVTLVVVLVATTPGMAETLPGALVRAYAGNPSLNAERAGVRATDENVPRALSGYRPSIAATASAGSSYATGRTGSFQGRYRETLFERQIGLQVSQNLFDGFRTTNSVRQAESQVLGSRESLRRTEHDTLYSAAQSYMDVLRDTAILDLQRNNVEVLEEQLYQTRERFSVGQITQTDVAQAQSRLAAAKSQVSVAGANLQASIAGFRQVVGVEPRRLAPGSPPDRLVPSNLAEAVRIAHTEHPAVVAAFHALDVAESQVKLVEGELAPTLNLIGAAGQGYDTQVVGDQTLSASIVAQLSVPLYEGGATYARVRQAKEGAGQRRIEADVTRDAVRANVVSSWGSLAAAKAKVSAAQAQVAATEVALTGVREEARVGQRTTLDVLNQQQELLNARVSLITAQRDRVVGAYAVAQSIGRLGVDDLGLSVDRYRSRQHYDQIRDLAWGLSTPDGR